MSRSRASGAPPAALRETCRVVGGRLPLWPFHRARLAAGGCGTTLMQQVDEAVVEAAAPWDGEVSPRVRLSVTVSPDGGVAIDVRRTLSSLDVPGGPEAVRVDVAAAPDLPTGAAKPADRTWWDDVQRAARAAGGHQGLAVDPMGNLVDGGTSTVWIAEGAALATPPAPPAVAGVARAFLLRAAHGPRIAIRVEPVSWERFIAADEAFFTNAFGGAVAVRGRGGAVFGAVGALFDEMWRSV